ncbi:hypothetical protein [Labrys wisconsinensis]|uniref:ABC-type amino acid transport substrate-binding protein n=1 Tax=Labrys wisconsinensis TaxID=425677 RepID=A0ABU0J2X5_9HYPH|nr:hypothetical protein [Labrys wisconsinensis]MDQ0467788.1 ABC-type amino acid transport substrate-binding protein [Labrys wisconsinensis]
MSMPRRSAALALLAGLLFAPAPLAAEEALVVVRGTDGLTPVPFTAVNAGGRPIACTAATAHWYSVELGTAAPGASIRTTLWASKANGEVFVLNARQDRMPLIDLWCGLAGRSWATRSPVPLARAAGAVPGDIALTCRDGDDTLVCR